MLIFYSVILYFMKIALQELCANKSNLRAQLFEHVDDEKAGSVCTKGPSFKKQRKLPCIIY